MAQLRRKLEPEPDRPRYLITEPGMGTAFSPRGLLGPRPAVAGARGAGGSAFGTFR